MKAKTSFSTDSDLSHAVASIAQDLQGDDLRLVLYFASSIYDPRQLAPAMAAAFPGVPLLGCSTAGEIVSGRMLDRSIVAMAFGSELIKRVQMVVLPGVGADARTAVGAGFKELVAGWGDSITARRTEQRFGIILTDGLSGAEETVMDELGNLTNLPIVGGSAGDDLQFKRTHLFAGAQAYTDAAVLAVIEAAVPFRLVKTQSFRVLSQTLTATRVNEARRQVLQFNGQPAARAYAAALGVAVADLPSRFMKHPLGLVVDGQPFVRSPQRLEGGAVDFYCRISEGSELHVLESTDIIEDTRRALGPITEASAVVNFHCILRTLELKDQGRCAAYGALFQGVPAIGFSTYGEAYIGHINQTSTILVLG
jgi:hypothetical protein